MRCDMPHINREQRLRLMPWLLALGSQLCTRKDQASTGAGKAQVCPSSAFLPQHKHQPSHKSRPRHRRGVSTRRRQRACAAAIPHTTTSPWGTTTSPYQDSAPCCEEEESFFFLGLPALPLTLCSLLPSHPFPLTLVPGPLPSFRSISEVPC